MIIEKKKKFVLTSVIGHSKNDLMDDNYETVDLRRIAKKSEKINDLAKEKNLIEEKRLEFLKGLISKRQNQQETKWNMKYLEMRKVLFAINDRTSSNAVAPQDKDTLNESLLPLREKTANSQVDSSSIMSPHVTTHQNCSTLSLFKTNSILLQTSSEMSTQATPLRSSSNSHLSSFFTNRKESSEKNCKYIKENCFVKPTIDMEAALKKYEDESGVKTSKVKIVTPQESPKPQTQSVTIIIPQAEIETNKTPISNESLSLPSSSYLSSSTKSSFSCKLFPCSQLRSYTSILDEKNDRRIKTAPARLESRGSSQSRITSGISLSSGSTNSYENVDENFAKSEYELSQIVSENFTKNISVRRPLRETQTLKDFQFKINALEAQAKFCKEQNYKNFKPSDRNIRYGEPLERKKIYRQLKLLAEFDKLIN